MTMDDLMAVELWFGSMVLWLLAGGNTALDMVRSLLLQLMDRQTMATAKTENGLEYGL